MYGSCSFQTAHSGDKGFSHLETLEIMTTSTMREVIDWTVMSEYLSSSIGLKRLVLAAPALRAGEGLTFSAIAHHSETLRTLYVDKHEDDHGTSRWHDPDSIELLRKCQCLEQLAIGVPGINLQEPTGTEVWPTDAFKSFMVSTWVALPVPGSLTATLC